jgi:hydroxyacyl-ACP dehydratase HTD2-like protein with hotdog domain
MIKWEEIKKDMIIPSIVKKPNAMQLFMFSAVTWNRHLIHYNKDFAEHDGLPDVAVHRALLGSFLGQLLTNWLTQDGEVKLLEWSVRGSAFPEDEIVCKGKVKDKEIHDNEKIVLCDVCIEKNGEVIVPGSATVKLFQ